MIAALRYLSVVLSVLALIGCQEQHPAIGLAESYFAKQNPEIEVVKTHIQKRDPKFVVVGIQFIRTPASAFPPKPGLYERELVFHLADDGEWKLVESRGDNYIRPAK